MIKKLVTITWSATVVVEVLDGTNNTRLLNANLAPQMLHQAFKLLQPLDGSVTDVQDDDAELSAEQRNADKIDGYDRDDLGESPDY